MVSIMFYALHLAINARTDVRDVRSSEKLCQYGDGPKMSDLHSTGHRDFINVDLFNCLLHQR